MDRTVTRILMLAAVLAIGLSASPALAQSDCRAELNADLRRTDSSDAQTQYRFAVDVKAHGEKCAYVNYDLVTTQELPDGTTKKYVKPNRIKLRGEHKSRLLVYSIRSSIRLVDWKFEIRSCEICPD